MGNHKMLKKKKVDAKTELPRTMVKTVKPVVAEQMTNIVYNVNCRACSSVGAKSDNMKVGYDNMTIIVACANCGQPVVNFARK